MTNVQPIMRASVFDGFGPFLGRRNIALEPILVSAGLAAQDIADPHAEISFNAVATVFETAAKQARDPCLGLAWSQEYPAGGLRTLGYIVLNSRTVREALRNVARYAGLLTFPLTIAYEEKTHRGTLSWVWPQGLTAPHVQYSIFAMGLLIDRLRRASKGHCEPLLAELDNPPLPCAGLAETIMGRNIAHDCGRYAIHFDVDTLDRRFADSDQRLLAIVKPLADTMLADLQSRSDLVSRTRAAMLSRMDLGDISLEAVAAQMALSPRALQARLAEAGTAYETLLTGTRKDMAERYMHDGSLTLTHIAFLLGYSELAAFTRAAQRWFGMPPSVYRQKLRSQ